jgi:hypothetical protein
MTETQAGHRWFTTIILATQEAEIRITVGGNLGCCGGGSLRLYLNGKKLGMVVHACHPSYGRKLKIGGSESRPAWAKSESLSPNNQNKKG